MNKRRELTVYITRQEYNKYFYTREEAIALSQSLPHNGKYFMGTPIIKVFNRYILAEDLLKLSGNDINDIYRIYKYALPTVESFKLKWILKN